MTEFNFIPEVGMGATEIIGTDRTPYTVIEVLSPRKIRVQADFYKRTDANGMSDFQTYEYAPNIEGVIETLTKRKDGNWRVMGTDDSLFRIGYRRKYYDYSF